MQYKITEKNPDNILSIEQIFYNRGFKDVTQIQKYINSSFADINSYNLFGHENIEHSILLLSNAILQNKKTLVVVDCDCDGYTSSAVLMNFLYHYFPAYYENVDYYLHKGKQHGLNDCITKALNYDFVIVPDAGTNDTQELQRLYDHQIPVLILDHHDIEVDNTKFACIINSQADCYPNKFLSGVGVVWQFCRAVEDYMGQTKDRYSSYLLDLVALGLTGDMMDVTEVETKHLIQTGFLEVNLHNPLLKALRMKNAYSIGEELTGMGAAFYIVPFINAIQRSGDDVEKDLIFRAMLESEQGAIVDLGYGNEPILDRGVKTCINVKNRQKRAEEKLLPLLEDFIYETGIIQNHKALIICDENEKVPSTLKGLVANKLAMKYQRPCCILTLCEDGVYRGSARGSDTLGKVSFKDICASCGAIEVAGHPNAFGVGVAKQNMDTFIHNLDLVLVDLPQEPRYEVDGVINCISHDVHYDFINDLINYDKYWGTGFKEPKFILKNVKIFQDDITLMKRKTVKFNICNSIDAIQFNVSDEDLNIYESFLNDRSIRNNQYLNMSFLVKCAKNSWNGNVSPQFIIEDYDIDGIETAF